MTQGYSGSYSVNGIDFQLQPTTGRWDNRNSLGFDGNGFPIYPSPRGFIVEWGVASPSDVKQLVDAYNAQGSTGTVVFDLPKWNDSGYQFYRYSGCAMSEPQVGKYFNEYFTDVSVEIYKIIT